MRFTKLRLNGFKSFVDPTDLIIQDGLTGVVGPNGCGKSNLLEALRWVMGENRPTAMRGGGMEDVIFAGAATRGARNFAEVALHIDNEDRLAPAGFNDEDMIDITRRITRDAGSAYKLNGKDVRARDVQMLFADASTGAHSPALVRQGQISELINAKPKARRRILEEAAGISGLYQRRHEAELKLKGAETNLARIDDVLEQLASQLGTLARQAKQAARYREIGGQLRQAEGLLLYLRWRDAEASEARAAAVLRDMLTGAANAEGMALKAAKGREESEAALPPLREEEAIAAAIMQRLMVERDTLDVEAQRAADAVTTLQNRVEQLTRDIEREGALNADAGDTIARLETERADLIDQNEGHDAAVHAAADEADEAATVLRQREQDLSEATEDAARLAARHQSADRRVSDAKKAQDRHATEAQSADAAAAEADAKLAGLKQDHATAEAALTAAQDLAARAETTLAETEAARATAQAAEAEARAARAEAEGKASTLEAEVTALTRLLERERGQGDQILDQVRVDKGYEAALGAALSDDLKAGVAGTRGGTGWTDLPGYDADAALPAGATPISEVTEAPSVLTRRLSQIGLVSQADGARLQADLRPGQRLVSVEGDLWRWDGYSVAASDAVSSAARRLEQANRLTELQADAEAASAVAADAIATHDGLLSRLNDLTEADKAARSARRDADTRLAEASRALSKADAEQSVLAGRLETLQQAAARHRDEAQAAETELARAEGARSELEDLDSSKARLEDIRTTVEAARMTMLARRASHDELKRDGERRTARIAKIGDELASWSARLDSATTRLSELESRRDETEVALSAARAAPDEIAEKRDGLAAKITEADQRKAMASDALSAAEGALRAVVAAEREAERAASEAREGRAAAEARRDAAAESVEAAAARIAEELEQTPEALRDSLGELPDPMPSSDAIEADVMRLRRQRDALGAVNLRAEEDAREVQEEHDTLASEKEDLEAAIAKLRSGIAGLNKEGRERLLAAFDEVNTNFSKLFTHLFGGGEARLVLVESDDPLEAGLEILCQPPGKKLSTLSLLSGGEQTLTALALIFAVFLANPAPICVLDEVDAPLDDANVTRFCDLLDEMTRQTDTRFLIITHHAVTMARMDRLFGVTMGEQGVSQLVSVDLNKAEQMVA
ncbi:MAG: AAA family ATPase [Pseudomonadota bacterium]